MNDQLIENGRIRSTTLGMDDSPFTAWLHLEFDGTGQGFGGYVLGGEFGMAFIEAVLDVVGVSKWEDLKGQYLRVRRDMPGFGGKIVAIGHIIHDRWFEPEVLAAELCSGRQS